MSFAFCVTFWPVSIRLMEWRTASPHLGTQRPGNVGPRAYPEAMALSKDEREHFLAEPHVAALSVSAGDTRGPLTVPIWYQYSPGGEPWLLTGVDSRKARQIEEKGFFSLMVERVEPTTRYVAVDGAVSRIEPGTDEQLVEMTHRYLSGEGAERYLQFARENLGANVAIFMQPQHWLSSDMGSF
ncbi:Pyridoxamine 5'-phosphate oxidase [Mycolicibacterium chlorophenolicum]|uniref:Pyridoxamine 5'-phosphate oxidase n=2 Tax=Mycolicibacterium chlorophenolicum TaxID=37916 RepID=A0A0J6VC87_9MYCO|nr:Pyridoxamine 5'-phosphate oxidase [Mycolicibacterium chlorophenolicum]